MMKSFRVLLVLGFSTAFCPSSLAQSVKVEHPPRPSPISNLLITRGAAGDFEIGMPVEEAYALAGHQNVRLEADFGIGGFIPELRIQLPGHQEEPSLVAPIMQSDCHEFILSVIQVNDARFRTKDGFGVGSILRDLKRRYPNADVGHLETDGGPSAIVQELGLTFSLEGPGPEIKDSWTVSSVWIYAKSELWNRHCPR
jgi:hypothetical protein